MKRVSVVLCLLAVSLLMFAVPASAEVDFDPSQYSVEELKEIQLMIHAALPKAEGAQVVYDKDGIYIEARGVKFMNVAGGECGVLDFYAVNDSEWDIAILVEDPASYNGAYINRCQVKITNFLCQMSKGTVYLSALKDNNVFYFEKEVLNDYNIQTVETVQYTLLICRLNEGSTRTDRSDVIDRVTVEMNVDIPLE